MEIPKVRLLSDPILRHKAEPVEGHHMPFLNGLVYTMIKVMKAEGGIGLAANQIGSTLAVFVLGIDGVDEEFINPEVINQDNLVDFEEACLSIPGTKAITKRYNTVTLRFNKIIDNALNVKHEAKFEGLKAIAIQHEMDHLNGKLYIDQFGPVKKSMVVDKHKKHLKQVSRGR